MTEVLLSNGGTVTNLEDPSCTHVVIIFFMDKSGVVLILVTFFILLSK